jgi:hypothetical protein
MSFAKLAFLKTGLMKEIGFRTFSQEDLNNNNQFVITHNKITKIVKATLYNPAGIEIARNILNYRIKNYIKSYLT